MPGKGKQAVMISLVAILAIFTAISLNPIAVNAHAPQKVMPAYDEGAKTLSVTITHTRFSEGHYINKIEIKKNGKVVAVQEYKGQPSETFTYTYKIDAASGDIFEVKASCNKFGSSSEKMTVGKG